jgi:hypothetical protein
MLKAIKDKNLKFMYRCPCGNYTTGMTVTHPWRLWCSKCRRELQNPDYPEYYVPLEKPLTLASLTSEEERK